MSGYIDVEGMRRAASTAESAADSMRRSAATAEESATRIAHMLEDGYGGNALRLIELLESADTSWKERALSAENDLLKLEARAMALTHKSLHDILTSLESEDLQQEEAEDIALIKDAWRFRNCVARKDFPIFWISSSGKQVWSTGIGVLPAFETAAECVDAGTLYADAGTAKL